MLLFSYGKNSSQNYDCGNWLSLTNVNMSAYSANPVALWRSPIHMYLCAVSSRFRLVELMCHTSNLFLEFMQRRMTCTYSLSTWVPILADVDVTQRDSSDDSSTSTVDFVVGRSFCVLSVGHWDDAGQTLTVLRLVAGLKIYCWVDWSFDHFLRLFFFVYFYWNHWSH